MLLEISPRALDVSAGGLDLALETIKRSFKKFMQIDDNTMTVFEIKFDDLVVLGKTGLDSEEGYFANLLCFASSKKLPIPQPTSSNLPPSWSTSLKRPVRYFS